MRFKKSKLYRWCREATAGIRYRPDRERVYEELLHHLEERYESFVEQGNDDETAQEKTVQAMGSAAELAPQLAALHRPFWGRTLLVSRVLLIVLLCAVLRMNGPFQNDLYAGYTNNLSYRLEEEKTQYDVRTNYFSLDGTDSSDGFYFELVDAATRRYKDEDTESLYIRVRIVDPVPRPRGFEAEEYFRAVDSAGNAYCSSFEAENFFPRPIPEQYILSALTPIERESLFTYSCVFMIRDFTIGELTWLELIYDRDGRDVRLRVDLTGGAL